MKTGLVKNRTYCFLGAINQLEAKPSVAGEESPVNGSVESLVDLRHHPRGNPWPNFISEGQLRSYKSVTTEVVELRKKDELPKRWWTQSD